MATPNLKRTVQFLLIDGTPTGRIQAKLDNWTGVAYRIPKVLLSASKDREDLKFCGVYFLFGRNDETGEDTVYIGQARERKTGESLLARFSEHSRSKDKEFCNELVFFTTTTDDFGPTELCYLENRFWNLANDARRCNLTNGNEPSIGNVTEAKQAELDRYIENAQILISALGYRIFDKKVQESSAKETTRFYFDRNTRANQKFHAEGLWTTEGFVVCKGSQVLMTERVGFPQSLRSLRENLIAKKILVPDHDDIYLLQDNQLFSSPSTAGSFVLGGPVNGRTSWKTKDGRTFADIENSES